MDFSPSNKIDRTNPKHKALIILIAFGVILSIVIAIFFSTKAYDEFCKNTIADRILTEHNQSPYFFISNVPIDPQTSMSIYEAQNSSHFSLIFFKKENLLYRSIGFALESYTSLKNQKKLEVCVLEIGDRKDGFTAAVIKNDGRKDHLENYEPSFLTCSQDYTILVWEKGKRMPLRFYDDFKRSDAGQ